VAVDGKAGVRRGGVGLDEVQKYPAALLWIGEDREHLHGGTTAVAAKSGRLSGGGRAVADVENDDVVISIPGTPAENPPPEQPLP
jgi:hypothetical protein